MDGPLLVPSQGPKGTRGLWPLPIGALTPSQELHPHGLITSQRPHLLIPSPSGGGLEFQQMISRMGREKRSPLAPRSPPKQDVCTGHLKWPMKELCQELKPFCKNKGAGSPFAKHSKHVRGPGQPELGAMPSGNSAGLLCIPHGAVSDQGRVRQRFCGLGGPHGVHPGRYPPLLPHHSPVSEMNQSYAKELSPEDRMLGSARDKHRRDVRWT